MKRALVSCNTDLLTIRSLTVAAPKPIPSHARKQVVLLAL